MGLYELLNDVFQFSFEGKVTIVCDLTNSKLGEFYIDKKAIYSVNYQGLCGEAALGQFIFDFSINSSMGVVQEVTEVDSRVKVLGMLELKELINSTKEQLAYLTKNRPPMDKTLLLSNKYKDEDIVDILELEIADLFKSGQIMAKDLYEKIDFPSYMIDSTLIKWRKQGYIRVTNGVQNERTNS